MIGKKVRRLRKAKGWTQGDLAKRARLGREAVTRIETEARRPNLETRKKLAKALDVGILELLD